MNGRALVPTGHQGDAGRSIERQGQSAPCPSRVTTSPPASLPRSPGPAVSRPRSLTKSKWDSGMILTLMGELRIAKNVLKTGRMTRDLCSDVLAAVYVRSLM